MGPSGKYESLLKDPVKLP